MKHIRENWFIYYIALLLVACIFLLPIALRKDNENRSNRARCESLQGNYDSSYGECWKNGVKI